MATLSEKDLLLLASKNDNTFHELKKSAVQKFTFSIVTVLLYIGVAYYFELVLDLRIALTFLVIAVLSLLIVLAIKTMVLFDWYILVMKMAFIGSIGYHCYFFGQETPLQEVILFAVLTAVYLFDFHQRDVLKTSIFLLFSILVLASLTIDLPVKILIGIALIFVALLVDNNLSTKEENILLKQQSNYYKVFMKHGNLVEHKVINSVTKIMYHTMSVQDSELIKGDEESQKHLDAIQGEISFIEKVILKTDREDIEQFDDLL